MFRHKYAATTSSPDQAFQPRPLERRRLIFEISPRFSQYPVTSSMAQQQLQHQNQSPPFTIEISGDDYVKYGAVHDDLIAKLRGLSPES